MKKHWRDLLNIGGIVLGVGLSLASLVRSWWVAGPLVVLGIGLLVTCTWLLARDQARLVASSSHSTSASTQRDGRPHLLMSIM